MNVVGLFNLAVGRLGISQTIANENENSNEARQCRRFYENSRDFALADFDWNCNRRRVAASQLAGALPMHWAYKYEYPANALHVRRIENPALRTPRADQRIPFEVASEFISNQDRKVIYCDLAPAVIVYGIKITNPEIFDAQLASAIAYLLASEIALPLAVKPDLAKAARDGYSFAVNRAATLMKNERQEDPEPMPGAIAARN